jgi:hypothetical protein
MAGVRIPETAVRTHRANVIAERAVAAPAVAPGQDL